MNAASSEVYISEPYMDQVSGQACITISRAVKIDGKVTGGVGIDFLLGTTKMISDYKGGFMEIQDGLNGILEKMNELGGQIHSIVDIADQTNLLSLNASIEAARAGEAGREFIRRCHLERKIALRDSYVHIKREKSGKESFGGDQGFFESRIGVEQQAKKKQNVGCGVVAFGDLLLYLGQTRDQFLIHQSRSFFQSHLKEVDYVAYFNKIYRLLGGVSFRGANCLQLMLQFNRLAFQHRWRLWAVWGLSGRKLFPRIQKMLAEDLPVILCIPTLLFRFGRKDGLFLYERLQDGKFGKAVLVRAHYVVVTSCFMENEEMWYEVSSWGKRYYFKETDYEALIHKYFLAPILGNILYIRKRI